MVICMKDLWTETTFGMNSQKVLRKSLYGHQEKAVR